MKKQLFQREIRYQRSRTDFLIPLIPYYSQTSTSRKNVLFLVAIHLSTIVNPA